MSLADYRDLSKFKDIPIIAEPTEMVEVRPRNITEQFSMIELPQDSKLTDIIYRNQEDKMMRKFEVD